MTAPKGARTTSSGRTYCVQGRELPSMSTVMQTMNKPGLAVWLQKRIAYAVAVDEHIRALAENEGTTYQAVRQALDTAPTIEADLGTAVHFATELYDLHGQTTAPEPLAQPYLDHWIAAREEWWLEPHRVERTVANPTLGYAGTFDREMITRDPNVADLIHPGCRKPHGLDVKTGKSVWPDVAIQVAGYMNAPLLWDPDTDTVEPHDDVCTEVGLVASLHADGCKLIPFDLTAAWEVIGAVCQLHEWEQVKGFVMGEPLPKMAGGLPW